MNSHGVRYLPFWQVYTTSWTTDFCDRSLANGNGVQHSSHDTYAIEAVNGTFQLPKENTDEQPEQSASDSGIQSENRNNFNAGRPPPEAADTTEVLSARPAYPEFNLMMVREIRIANGERGYGYDTVFADGINERLHDVTVDEPYLRTKSQATNFTAFCELLVARAPNLRMILLRTLNVIPFFEAAWMNQFKELQEELNERDIQFRVVHSSTIHDREIRFDNGWTYRLGRGLDYFQRLDSLSLGITDYNFRKCNETVICILKSIDQQFD